MAQNPIVIILKAFILIILITCGGACAVAWGVMFGVALALTGDHTRIDAFAAFHNDELSRMAFDRFKEEFAALWAACVVAAVTLVTVISYWGTFRRAVESMSPRKIDRMAQWEREVIQTAAAEQTT
ncbi:uncharacterized protein B0H64DRAFT_474375 [Chaetomium fimeti]|uniref:Uncharacterized protein n=1 Tax=Chaetomium fimeti TaxID=1854472 RepID=A0AAE0HFD8_9PEZI|nr:hypothetical protein B0H64DRAFT_474375 [Chaetomium fimeti]